MKLALLLLSLGLKHILFAQSFTEATQSIPFEGVKDGSVAFADVNGDAFEDVLITGEVNSDTRISKLYLNDGTGSFTEMMNTPFVGVSKSSIAFADVDNDNDQDVLITGLAISTGGGNSSRITRLYLNDGAGNFTEMTASPFATVVDSSVIFADVDNDSDQDVLMTDIFYTELYLNDGAGNFTVMPNTPFADVISGSNSFSDVNNDGFVDVLITGLTVSQTFTAKLYLNDGAGTFNEMVDTPFDGVWLSSVAFSDVNGDSFEDVLITGANASGQADAKLYLNDGTGNFTEAMNTPFEGVVLGSIAFADVNGDSVEDVIITGSNGATFNSKLYLNDGIGNFAETLDTPFKGVFYSSIAFADVDNDSDQDIFITGENNSNETSSVLYTNDLIISSIDDLSVNVSLDLTPFPNPVTSKILNVSFDSKKSDSVIIRLLNLDGQLISQQKEFVAIGEQSLDVNIASLPKGSYLIQLEIGQGLGVAKFIVQ